MKPNRCVELSRVEREAQNALVGLVLLATPLANLPLPPFTPARGSKHQATSSAGTVEFPWADPSADVIRSCHTECINGTLLCGSSLSAAEEPYYEHRGTVIVKDGEMVLEVEYPGGRPYLIRGKSS